MRKQNMKETKPLKFKVVWMRGGIISKVQFDGYLYAISFANTLDEPAHVYNINTFELVFLNKYCRKYNNATR